MTETDPRQLPPQYAPSEVEARRYAHWEAAGLMRADAKAVSPSAPAFAMVIPPPNVTGSLHIGHALDHTLMDALVRRRRMQGYTALWLPGMDHAGIATQNVVERELAKEGLSRHDLGREKFIERVWQWKAESGGKILGQMRRLGDSVDWDRERFTMDAGLSRAVQTIFKRLFDDGLIYRAERIINWCPRCMTALSDIEVDHTEDEGELVSIRYGDGDDSIVVATTRVETMLGDTAVAVHPDDSRYSHLVGREIELPLSGRRIPVVADPHVDPEFGTGAVKVTPAHDPDDFEIGRRHQLPSLMIMDERGVITAHGPFVGLDRFEARPAVRQALREEGRIVAERRPYLHAVGHCGRCGTTVEPRLSLQWFVKVGPLAKAAGDAVRDGRVAIHPAEMSGRYFDWVDDMHDWCISRQLWWGHRIPVWYSSSGETVCVGPDEDPPGEGWTQDGDVLDTWFSSALWPFSTLGWPDDTEDLRAFYPTSVLVTGYDILFFWVVRMMMFGLYAMSAAGPSSPCRSATWPCTAWSATSTARRCPSPAATPWTRWTGSTGSARTPPGSPWPAGPAPAATWRSARTGSPGPATSATSCGTRPASRCSTVPTQAPRALTRPRWAPPTGGSCPGWPRSPRPPTTCSSSTSSARPARGCTTSPGTSSATGTWSWPSPRWPAATRAPWPPPGRCSGSSSTGCCGCCTR